MLAAQLRDRHTTFALAQNCKNLGVAISRHLHQNLLRYLAKKILLPHPLSFGGGLPHDLSKSIDEADFDQVSIEDKHCCNDLNLLEKFQHKTVIFGSLAIASSRLETTEEIVERLKAALNHIDRDRLVVAPDCGLGLLPKQLAEDKLRVMCKAAALI